MEGRYIQLYRMGPGAADQTQTLLPVGFAGNLDRNNEGGIGSVAPDEPVPSKSGFHIEIGLSGPVDLNTGGTAEVNLSSQ